MTKLATFFVTATLSTGAWAQASTPAQTAPANSSKQTAEQSYVVGTYDSAWKALKAELEAKGAADPMRLENQAKLALEIYPQSPTLQAKDLETVLKTIRKKPQASAFLRARLDAEIAETKSLDRYGKMSLKDAQANVESLLKEAPALPFERAQAKWTMLGLALQRRAQIEGGTEPRWMYWMGVARDEKSRGGDLFLETFLEKSKKGEPFRREAFERLRASLTAKHPKGLPESEAQKLKSIERKL